MPLDMKHALPFASRLHQRRRELGTAVCLGLDPRPSAHPLTDPGKLGADHPWDERVAAAVRDYCLTVLEATADVIAACKPQAAFFEALGPAGSHALAGVMDVARGLGVPVIIDAKRGDIGSTAEAYAAAYLEDGPLAADAMTINPYLGFDTLAPFIEAARANGRGLYVLVRTSNPGSADLQELPLAGGGTVAARLAERLAALARELPQDEEGYCLLGAVAGAPNAMAELRAALPASPLLVPGYGAQGSTADDVLPALDAVGMGAVVSASRTLTYGDGFSQAATLSEVGAMARSSAVKMRDELEAALAKRAGG